MTTVEFIKDYWGCDDELISNWREAMEKLPIADYYNVLDLMAEYAKYHVKLALEVASENATIKTESVYNFGYFNSSEMYKDINIIDKDSILSAYNLDDIE